MTLSFEVGGKEVDVPVWRIVAVVVAIAVMAGAYLYDTSRSDGAQPQPTVQTSTS